MESTLIKLLLSAAVGIVLGLEREAKQKPLGLKTCLIISMTSCLLTVVSIESAAAVNKGNTIMRADPMRLAAQIVSGIGFLGAGVIFRRGDEIITGLTTAAIVWAAASLGICIALARLYFFSSFFGLALIMISVEIIPYVRNKIGFKRKLKKDFTISVIVKQIADIEKITKEIHGLEIQINNINLKELKDGHEVHLSCTAAHTVDIEDIYIQMQADSHIKKAKVESI
ncbi:MgtC/SapB family protein [Terrilactibacillus sp. S3-3]|nr:MgtC/SapB family protein [Terrilactibacillus sp. S3-3]